MQQCGQPVQLVGRTHGIHLDAAVILISDPAAHTDLSGMFLNEPAEADALHVAGNEPASRALFQTCAPTGARPDRASLTAEVSRWGVNGLGTSAKPFSTTYFCTTWRSS